jgi:hypothetical protein
MTENKRAIVAIFLIFALSGVPVSAAASEDPKTDSRPARWILSPFVTAENSWRPLWLRAGIEAAEENPAGFNWRFGGDYIRKASSDLVKVWTAPARWGGSDFLKAAVVVGATGLLYAFDREIYTFVQDNKTDLSVSASSIISKMGNGGYLTGFLAVLYGSGELFNSRPLRKTALVGLESFIAASTVILALKVVVGRARPYTGEEPVSFHPFSFVGRYMSFASGDSAGAFAVATTIAEQSNSAWVDVLAYGAAGLVALYRVHDRKHWPSDIFVGSVIGYFTARAVNALNKDGGSGPRVSFQTGPDRRSITFSFAF